MRLVRVWDGPTRLFHWLVVALVIAAYVTSRLNWMNWHVRVGYTLLTLVIFRILWGFFGSETSRFVGFLAAPRSAALHLAHMFRREMDRQVGHNPAGGWMVLLLLLLLLGEGLSGVYVANDVADEGPLTELVPAAVANVITNLHTIIWWALIAAVMLHLLAILAYALAKGQNLLGPMLTGYKPLPADIQQPLMARTTRAAVLLILSALAAALLAYLS
jgi:cytochrome b